MKEKHILTITVFEEKGRIVTRLRGITSGFVVHSSDDDNVIEFGLDATRFDLEIVYGNLQRIIRAATK